MKCYNKDCADNNNGECLSCDTIEEVQGCCDYDPSVGASMLDKEPSGVAKRWFVIPNGSDQEIVSISIINTVLQEDLNASERKRVLEYFTARYVEDDK